MSILVNFRMSEHLKTAFDNISVAKQIPKSYIINTLVEQFVRDEAPKLIRDKENARALVGKTTAFEKTYDEENDMSLPSVFLSSGNNGW